MFHFFAMRQNSYTYVIIKRKHCHQGNTDLNICSDITEVGAIILSVKLLTWEFQADLKYTFLGFHKLSSSKHIYTLKKLVL